MKEARRLTCHILGPQHDPTFEEAALKMYTPALTFALAMLQLCSQMPPIVQGTSSSNVGHSLACIGWHSLWICCISDLIHIDMAKSVQCWCIRKAIKVVLLRWSY